MRYLIVPDVHAASANSYNFPLAKFFVTRLEEAEKFLQGIEHLKNRLEIEKVIFAGDLIDCYSTLFWQENTHEAEKKRFVNYLEGTFLSTGDVYLAGNHEDLKVLEKYGLEANLVYETPGKRPVIVTHGHIYDQLLYRLPVNPEKGRIWQEIRRGKRDGKTLKAYLEGVFYSVVDKFLLRVLEREFLNFRVGSYRDYSAKPKIIGHFHPRRPVVIERLNAVVIPPAKRGYFGIYNSEEGYLIVAGPKTYKFALDSNSRWKRVK